MCQQKIYSLFQNEYFHTYKQAKRKENDGAIVNAAMKVIFEDDSNKVKNVVLAFSGTLALHTMAHLKGK